VADPHPDTSSLTRPTAQAAYDAALLHDVYEVARPVTREELDRAVAVGGANVAPAAFVVTYAEPAHFEGLASALGLMSDRRVRRAPAAPPPHVPPARVAHRTARQGNVPRGAYMGIVAFRRKQHRVYVAPPQGRPHGY
jgi:hypothetical protein